MFLIVIFIIVLVFYFGRDYIFPKRYETIDDKFNQRKAQTQKEVDRILDKINKKGIESLSDKERRTLDEFSEK
jgi:hypothetical protein